MGFPSSFIVNERIAEQCALTHDQFLLLCLHVMGQLMKVGVAQLFGESVEAVHQDHRNRLPRANEIDLNTIHRPMVACEYAKNAYLNQLLGQRDHLCTRRNMVTTGMYVRNSSKLGSTGEDANAQSWKSHTSEKLVCLDPKMRVALFPNDMHQAGLGSHFAKS